MWGETLTNFLFFSTNLGDTPMCAINDGNSFFRPMVKGDLPYFENAYPSISREMIGDIFAAMTNHNTVRPAVMLIVLEGVYRLESGLFGNSSFGATFAYSALQIHDGGNGEIFHRFQDPIMAHIHDAMLQFALAERNMRLVQDVLTSYGYNLTHFCDCGCGITRDGDDYMNSSEYSAVNYIRSYGESIGAPVHAVATIDELPLPLTDMHQDEVDGYKRVWTILQELPVQSFDGEYLLSAAFEQVINMKGRQHAPSTHSQREHPVGQPIPSAGLTL